MAHLRVRGVPDDRTASPGPDTGRFSDLVGVSTALSLRTGEVRGSADHTFDVADDQVVELGLDGGIRLITSIAQLRDTLEWSGVRSAGDEMVLPASLQIGPASRGAGRWVHRTLKLLNVDLGGMAADQMVRALEGRLLGSGQGRGGRPDDVLFRCATPHERGERITAAGQLSTASPLLLFLHGTASSTSGSFGGLVTPGARTVWDRMRTRYGDNILGYDHPTLSASPIRNALKLVKLLPEGATLHLVSHSRGGLIGELLCRGRRTDLTGAGDGVAVPFDDNALRRFAGAKYEAERRSLRELNQLLRAKSLRVERFVRVACPARGTTLASGRLDFYLSTIFNAIGLIPAMRGSPVYEFITALLSSVAKQRTDPRSIPGLEAMIPESALIGVLNDPRVCVDADLTAITGDTEGAGVAGTLRTFVTDLFYRENHDLVVQTSAMAGGAARVEGARFHFAKGPQVDHFRYFRNADTAEKVFRALTRAAGSDDGFERVTGATAAELKTRAPTVIVPGTRPIAFVVPGIMGSHLGVSDERYWIDPLDLARGRFGELAIDRVDIEAQALVGRTYDRLVAFLGSTHEVVPFPYDWRRSILDAAGHLRDAVAAKLGETKQPVRIVAHSMGGLVARAMFAQNAELRERFAERSGSRLLMLGTPNGGSHSIPRVLLGQEKVLKYLALLDFSRSTEELLHLLVRFTGVLQLMPASGVDDFFDRDIWDTLRAAHDGQWVVPSDEDLADARELWTLLRDAPADARFMTYVAGRAPATPIGCDIDLTRRGRDRIRFLATREGDGRVPWATGRLPNVRTWYVPAVHGELANHRAAFRGYLDLLERGTTSLLPDQAPAETRGESAIMVMPEDEADLFPDADALIAAAFGSAGAGDEAHETESLAVSVAHGNLAYARDPVAVGHYAGDSLAGAEAALDRHLCGALEERRHFDLYPGSLETAEIFLRDSGRPAGAIIVGLGDVGWLTPGELERSFAHAVLRYATVVAEQDSCTPTETIRTADITTLLIGSGRGGIPLGDSIRAIVNGTLRARASLRGTPLEKRVRIDRIEFLELYEDIAISAARTLRALERDRAFRGRIQVQPHVRSIPGGRRRAIFEEMDGWWDRLQIRTQPDGVLLFNNLTRRARNEVRLVATQRTAVDHFVQRMTGSTAQDDGMAATLFELLLPNQLKEYAPDRNALVLLLDEQSARYPWELLQDQAGVEPIAVRAGLIRQLEDASFTHQVVAATGDAVLVVGDPVLDNPQLPQLPGARREAEVVAEAFAAELFNVTPLIGSDFGTILRGLYAAPYRVIHLAGHGVLQQADGEHGGMAIGRDVFLTTAEIGQLRHVPDVVFINCCHIGSITDDHPRLAATLARQLIRMGVRAVVAAGWAVEDEGAATFARTFYERLLGEVPFGDAVLDARRATYAAHPSSNTWGAYQCYGDQGFVLRSGRRAAYVPRDREDFVSVTEVLIALDNICQDADITSQAGLEELRSRLAGVQSATPADWRDRADVRAAIGRACAQLDMFRDGIRNYRRLRTAKRADYTVAGLEQLANLTSRYAVHLWQRRGRPAGARACHLRAVVRRAIDDLYHLPFRLSDPAGEKSAATLSSERWGIIGSAWKRLSQITNDEVRLKALEESAKAYEQAARVGDSFYPRLNHIACELLLERIGGVPSSRKLDDALREAERLARDTDRDNPDFWTGAAVADAETLRGLIAGDTHQRAPSIIALYTAAWRRGGSLQKLNSVLEHTAWLIDCLDGTAAAADVASLREVHERVRALPES